MDLRTFRTDRLAARDWTPLLDGPAERQRIETALTGMLTPAVLRHLPGSMRLSGDAGAIPDWIAARRGESEVFVVEELRTGGIIGLLILAADPGQSNPPAVHLGYLFTEVAWGKGYASELLSGFVDCLSSGPSVRLIGGVENDNPASARVLLKAGFTKSKDPGPAGTEIFQRIVC
jgi:RimJ/RimL family protein N-acetyltransferase